MNRADAIRDILTQHQPVLLTGPTSPDGDSLGACLALQRLLVRRGVRVDVVGTPASRYRWLPGVEHLLPDHRLQPSYASVVVLDGDRHRLTPEARAAFDTADIRAIVDHHASTREDGYTHTWLEPHATSTCEMLYRAVIRWREPLDLQLATLLYAGSVFDTGGFRYSNTTPATHRMAAHLLEVGVDHVTVCARLLMERRPAALRIAGEVFRSARLLFGERALVGEVDQAAARALGLIPGDLEGIVDTLVHVTGVEVAALVVQRSPTHVKISLRSRGSVDVAAVAQRMVPSGGGHAKASGALLATTMADASQRLEKALEGALEDTA